MEHRPDLFPHPPEHLAKLVSNLFFPFFKGFISLLLPLGLKACFTMPGSTDY